jgi:arabinan endo-1,5-alpha-L-arabinosidase
MSSPPRLLVLAAIPALMGVMSFHGRTPASHGAAPAARAFLFGSGPAQSQGDGTAQLAEGVPASRLTVAVHDPCIIRDHVIYHVFATGPGIPEIVSTDLVHWKSAGAVFEGGGPEWIRKELPESRGLWAPDICYFGGRYHLTYAVSRFGSNRSIIGAASNKTLDRASRDYAWVDEGKVTESRREDNFNAIDPNLLPLDRKRVALTFGSFWSGIKLLMLDAATGKPEPDAKPIALAQRPSPDALEAPFLIRRGRWFYLFVSFDFCCRGLNSTYNVRVGRAEHVEGPYLDREGKPMLQGGGTQLTFSEGTRVGPGHCAVLRDGGHEYLTTHYYDGARNGLPTLQVCPLTWDRGGWPVVGKALAP